MALSDECITDDHDYMRKADPMRDNDTPAGEAKEVLADIIDRLKKFMDFTQARADKHRKLAEHYQAENDSVRGFLAANYFDSAKSTSRPKQMREPF